MSSKRGTVVKEKKWAFYCPPFQRARKGVYIHENSLLTAVARRALNAKGAIGPEAGTSIPRHGIAFRAGLAGPHGHSPAGGSYKSDRSKVSSLTGTGIRHFAIIDPDEYV